MTHNAETDPVCGMSVDPTVTVAVSYRGQEYYFCEAVCADMFRDDPDRWIPQELTVEV
ncbi:MAG: YHS domain-containing protein [Candidatus Limnocylindrales bacterium]